jgi:hypothetical protein
MHQFRRIFNALFSRYNTPSTPRLLYITMASPDHPDPKLCSLFHLRFEIDLMGRTCVRPATRAVKPKAMLTWT